MRAPFCAGFLLLALLLAGCAPSATVTKGGGATIGEAQAEHYDGPKARIAVGTIVDKTSAAPLKSLSFQLSRITVSDSNSPVPDANGVLSGIRDMLTTALFQSNRYIVLERATLSDALVEQEFSASGKVGEASRIPMGQIEGAELLVVGALTAFNPGISGGVGFPVPIPLNKRGDMAILDVQFRKGYAAMDLRVIDTRTARIVASVAVEGSSYKFGAAVSGIATTSSGSIRLPVILRGFTNTPAERAISEMVDAAVANIVEKTPPVYFHDDPQDSGSQPAPATNPPVR
jgi:curli biogenesis system outer membrane secretion channel CsgG